MERSKEFQRFCNQITEAVRRRFSEDAKVEIHRVLKNNSLELDSLVILSGQEIMSPNFYLQLYYEAFLDGKDIEDLAEQIEETYYEVLQNGKNMELDMSYECCARKVVFRLVSYKFNKELLETVPFIPFLDMAVTFHILLRSDNEGIGSVRITNKLIETWDIDTKGLFVLARENTMRLFPRRMFPMFSMMEKILDGEKSSVSQNFFEEQVIEQIHPLGEPFVITNSNGINGAAVILYSDTLKEVGSLLGEDYYLLPSSIHELLAVPVSASISELEMIDMVREVNQVCVAREEVLSESIYRYERGTDSIKVCEP